MDAELTHHLGYEERDATAFVRDPSKQVDLAVMV
jgi:hypothetical protein